MALSRVPASMSRGALAGSEFWSENGQDVSLLETTKEEEWSFYSFFLVFRGWLVILVARCLMQY